MAKIKIRYLVAKPQAGGHTLYYWQPGRALREAGFLPRRLAERTNSVSDAIQEAEALNREVDVWRAGAQPLAITPGTLPWLVRLYRSDPRYTELAPKTQRSYEQCIKVIEEWSARAGHPPITSIERKHVRAFYRSMSGTPAKANAVIRVLRLLLAFAVDEGLLAENPAAKQRLKGRPPRQAVWRAEEVALFCSAAHASGRPSFALSVLLAANLGQREGDILKLSWNQYDGQKITLRQSKTGRLIDVPVIGELKAALADTPRRSPNIVVSETTGRPYKEDNFRHVFAEISKEAGLSGLWFMDLRRTAVVWLAEAGCEIPEIAAITGHSLDRTSVILEVYLPRNTKMAQNAIAKLSEHRKRTKLEV